jgi:hypothetical protein
MANLTNQKPATVEAERPMELVPAIRVNQVNWQRALKIRAGCDEVRQSLEDSCVNQNVRDVAVRDPYRIEGRFFSEQHKMAEFTVYIFTAQDENGCNEDASIVEINRGCGCAETFQQFLILIVKDMGTRVVILSTGISTESEIFSSGWLPLALPMMDDMDTSATPEFLEDLVDTLENGYANEIESAASTLASETEKPESVEQLKSVNQAVERLLHLVQRSKDVLVVRSVIISLANMAQYSEMLKQRSFELEINARLSECKNRWSHPQRLFEEMDDLTINPSSEIMAQVDRAIRLMA